MSCRSFQSRPVQSQLYSIHILFMRYKTILTSNLIDVLDEMTSVGDLNQVFVYEVYTNIILNLGIEFDFHQ